MTRLSKLISSFLLPVLLGCSIPLTGGGTLKIGWESHTYAVISHETNPGLDGVKSEAKLEVTQSVLDAILPSQSDSEPDPL